jgi:starvation-inducible DNA-binding protein
MSKSEKKQAKKFDSNNSPIGLETKSSAELADKLNNLLANYQLFYQNTRGFHWNIQGDDFFTLHIKFEELYTNLQLKIDEVAERVLTIGFTPHHSFDTYLEESSIQAVKNVTNGKEVIKHILDSFKTVILKQRELLEIAAKAGDEGTNSLMSDYITEQEKLVWMYSAYLGK